MRLLQLICLLTAVSTGAASAETLRCTVDSYQGANESKWISSEYEFQIDRRNQRATIIDATSEMLDGGPTEGELDGNTAKQRIISWKIIGESTVGKPAVLLFRASWKEKNNKFIVRVASPYYGNEAVAGFGSCIVAE